MTLPAGDGPVSTDSTLTFVAGARSWVVPATSVREIHADLDIQPIPGTAHWFCGTALPRGRVITVSDFSAWLGHADEVDRFIEFEAGFALAVTRVAAALPADRTRGGHLLDPLALLQVPAFLDVSGAGGSPGLVGAT